MDFTEISVDPKFHRHLIGKGGVNSKYHDTATEVQLLPQAGAPSCGQGKQSCICIFLTTVNFTLFTVNRIKELHKVTVRIPPDNEKSNLIRIEGDPQGVQEAKKELLELASRMVGRNLGLQAKCC